MAGLFVAALVIPQAWTRGTGAVAPAVVLALAFTVVRISYVSMFVAISRGDRQLRTQVTLDAALQGGSSVLLLVGAGVGGTFQTVFWAAAFAVDFGGGRIVSTYSGWRLASPRHFVERHGLVLIIAIGETLVSAGSGVGQAVSRAPVLLAALLGLMVAVSLWWLYFHHLAGAAEQALIEAAPARRAALARDAYTLGHFPLIAGVVYVALGLELLLGEIVAGRTHGNLVTAALVLCGGVSLYLVGLRAFRRILLGPWRRSRRRRPPC
jgi:low temperature requirement protein LtrA